MRQNVLVKSVEKLYSMKLLKIIFEQIIIFFEQVEIIWIKDFEKKKTFIAMILKTPEYSYFKHVISNSYHWFKL